VIARVRTNNQGSRTAPTSVSAPATRKAIITTATAHPSSLAPRWPSMIAAATTPAAASIAATATTRRNADPASCSVSRWRETSSIHGPTASPTMTSSTATASGSGGDGVCSTMTSRNTQKPTRPRHPSATNQSLVKRTIPA
jgi:hypothetical protein